MRKVAVACQVKLGKSVESTVFAFFIAAVVYISLSFANWFRFLFRKSEWIKELKEEMIEDVGDKSLLGAAAETQKEQEQQNGCVARPHHSLRSRKERQL